MANEFVCLARVLRSKYAARSAAVTNKSANRMRVTPSIRATKKTIEKIPIPNGGERKSLTRDSEKLLPGCGHANAMTRYPDARQREAARAIAIIARPWRRRVALRFRN